MSKCYVVWAWNVWASIAFSILHQNIYSQIILVDIFKDFAKAQAMDLADAGSAMWSDTIVSSWELDDIQDEDFLIITAWIPQKDANQSRLELIDQNKQVMQVITNKLKETKKSPMICVVSNPVDIMTNYIYQELSDFPVNKIFGSGTILDSARLRLVISQKNDLAISQVKAFVAWEHGDSSISLLSIAKAWDKNIYTDLAEADYAEHNSFVARRAYEIIAGKKSTYYGIWMCLSQIAKILNSNNSEILPLSVKLNWQYWLSGTISIPVKLSAKGWEYIADLDISEYELAKLQESNSKLSQYL